MGEFEAEISQEKRRIFPEGSWSICNRIFREFRRYPDNGVMWNMLVTDQISNHSTTIMFDAQNGNLNLLFDNVRVAVMKMSPDDLRFGQAGEMKNQHWFHTCVTFNNETGELSMYANGRLVGSENIKFPSQKNRSFKLWVGTQMYTFENKLIGMQSSLNLFSTILNENEALAITGCKYDLPGDVIDGNDTKWTLTERVKEIFMGFEEICPSHDFKVFVIANRMSSRAETMDLCTKLGLQIVVPNTIQEYKVTYSQGAYSTAMKERCSASKRQRLWNGVTWNAKTEKLMNPYTQKEIEVKLKYSGDFDWFDAESRFPESAGLVMYTGPDFHDFDNSNGRGMVPSEEFLPQGSPYHTCAPCISHTGVVPSLSVRGLCPDTQFDTQLYFNLDTAGYPRYVGIANYIILFNYTRGVWVMQAAGFPNIQAWSESTEKSLLLGSSTWTIQNDVGCQTGEVLRKLKITSCQEGQFTCDSGLCIDLNHRCDGLQQCADGTDEDMCNFIILPETYKKEIAPITLIDSDISRAIVNISVEVKDIMKISEVEGIINIKFSLYQTWIDQRHTYHNLKRNKERNEIVGETKNSIWIPKLIFRNTEQEERSSIDEATSIVINRKGKYKFANHFHMHEIMIFNGNENTIEYKRTYSKTFKCGYILRQYPFDTQTCFIEMVLPEGKGSFVKLVPDTIKMMKETELSQYFVKNWTILNDKNENKSIRDDIVLVKITLGRKIFNQVLISFLPSSLIILVSYTTNFYKDFFFEAAVTVNLTSLLVLTTMFLSVSDSLPPTSYVKMIEIWLLFSLMIPFLEVMLHTYMDSLRVIKVLTLVLFHST